MTGTVKKRLWPLLAAILACQLGACSGRQSEQYNNYLQTFVGQSAERLVRMWGAPQHTAQRPDGSSVIEYRERNVERVAVPVTGSTGAATSVRIENRISSCLTQFTVRNGVVESSTFQGTDCRAP